MNRTNHSDETIVPLHTLGILNRKMDARRHVRYDYNEGRNYFTSQSARQIEQRAKSYFLPPQRSAPQGVTDRLFTTGGWVKYYLKVLVSPYSMRDFNESRHWINTDHQIYGPGASALDLPYQQ